MRYLCTYFDRNYLYKGLAMYRSFARHNNAFQMWVLCLDDDTHRILSQMSLPGVKLVTMEDFEGGDPELLGVKGSRSHIEYYWTCTSSFLLHVLRHNPQVDVLTYLDADLYFFGSLDPLYEEMGQDSILIVEHRYSPKHAHAVGTTGIFNVGVLSFRRDEAGLECLGWWRERCIEWCYNRVEDGRFGDQRYLDDWPSRFPNVHILQHKGIDLAPWNIDNYRLSYQNGKVIVDDDQLVAYHFHSLRIVADGLFELADRNHYPLTRQHTELVYRPYLKELREAISQVRQLDPHFNFGYANIRLIGKIGGVLLRWLVYEPSKV